MNYKLLTILNIALLFLILLTILNNYNISNFESNQKIYIVSFAHNCCKLAQENLEKTAYKAGANKVFNLTLDTLEAPEDVKKYILNNKRGAGYWIWKPYAMKQVIKLSAPDDIIIYVDSSTYFNKSLQTISDFINKNNILF